MAKCCRGVLVLWFGHPQPLGFVGRRCPTTRTGSLPTSKRPPVSVGCCCGRQGAPVFLHRLSRTLYRAGSFYLPGRLFGCLPPLPSTCSPALPHSGQASCAPSYGHQWLARCLVSIPASQPTTRA